MASGTPSAPDPAPALAPQRLGDGRSVRLRLGDGRPVWLRACVDKPDEDAEIVAADADGRVVGRAGYRRVYGPRAVLTLTVDDELLSAGLAETMIATISSIAAAADISKLLMRVPLSDDRLLGLLVDGFGARCRRDVSYVDLELDAVATCSHGCVVRADAVS